MKKKNLLEKKAYGGIIGAAMGGIRTSDLSKAEKAKLRKKYNLKEDSNITARNVGRGLLYGSLGSIPGAILATAPKGSLTPKVMGRALMLAGGAAAGWASTNKYSRTKTASTPRFELEERKSLLSRPMDTTGVGIIYTKKPGSDKSAIAPLAIKERRPLLIGRKKHREKAEKLKGKSMVIGSPDKAVPLKAVPAIAQKFNQKNKDFKMAPFSGDRDVAIFKHMLDRKELTKKASDLLEKHAISNRAIQSAVDKRLGRIITDSMKSREINKVSPLVDKTLNQLSSMGTNRSSMVKRYHPIDPQGMPMTSPLVKNNIELIDSKFLTAETAQNIKTRKIQLAEKDLNYRKLLHEAHKNIFVN